MSNKKQKLMQWHNWTLVGLRVLFLLVISLAIYLWPEPPQPVETNEMLIASGVGIAVVIIFGVTIPFKMLQMATPFVLILGDLILAGIYVYVTSATPLFMVGIVAYLVATGMVNLGWIYGPFHAIGVVAVAFGVTLISNEGSDINSLVDPYTVPTLIMVMVTLGIGLWVFARSRFGDGQVMLLNKMATENEQRLEEMRERAENIAELTAILTSTLNFEKILEATLGIGEISLSKDSKTRVISMAMLFRSSDDALYIADSRGLHGATDTSRVIWGEAGIVADALTEAVPVIGADAWKDPELKTLGGMNDIRSVLCIPLRANYDNFGVLVYGSEEPNGFNEDHLGTLHAIGLQAATSLQNAVLYSSLMEEKERIIQMEENARKDLVRDLHDIPTQTISGVAMRLRIAMRMLEKTPEEVPAELENIEALVLRATEEIRHVLFKLRPLVLESRGLTAALEELAEKMKATYGQNMMVKVGKDVEQYLDETQQGAIFYLIEEAANNARKYAEAELISVQIVRQNDVLGIQIRDNGKGFDTTGIEGRSADQGSFGMTNMRERAELIDGRLNIKSAVGQGTVITVMIPIDMSKSDPRAKANGNNALPKTKLAVSVRERL